MATPVALPNIRGKVVKGVKRMSWGTINKVGFRNVY